MNERDFAVALMESLRTELRATCWRPADGFTLGLPDVMGVVPPHGTFIALEAKALSRMLADPYATGRRTAPLLHHPFEGPQISMLEKLSAAGAYARGIIRVTSDHAFLLTSSAIKGFEVPGNPTHHELVLHGVPVMRDHGIWRTWPVAWEGR